VSVFRSPTGRSPLTVALGVGSVLSLGLLSWWGLSVSPPDQVQGQLVRMIYIHPAMATYCYLGLGLCALGSVAWLLPRTRHPRWDRLAVAGAEVGAVFCLATLVTGSIWGRAAWGVWWTWDARLTLTAILFAMVLGYLALRRAVESPQSRSTLSSLVALVMALTVVVDHYATAWWRTLHQGETLFRPNPQIQGWQLATMLFSFVAFGLVFAWMTVHRYRLEVMEERYEHEGVMAALQSRRAEASAVTAPTAASSTAGAAGAAVGEVVELGVVPGGENAPLPRPVDVAP
jgi:heme exporter protein C